MKRLEVRRVTVKGPAMKTSFSCALAMACAATAVTLATIGPLVPPAGAPASSGKTTHEIYTKLTEIDALIEPGEARIPINDFTASPCASAPGVNAAAHRISQPGSYHLTGNLSVPSSKSGITIASSDVTIDLNGHSIASSNGAYGIYVPNESSVVNCSAIANSGAGFQIGSSRGGVVINCIAPNNGSNGIFVGLSAVFTGCSVVENTDGGIFANSGSVVRQNAVTSNSTIGIEVVDDTLVEGNSVSACTADGIKAANICLIPKNLVVNAGLNAGTYAINVAGSSCRVEGNAISESTRGVQEQGTSSLISRNSVCLPSAVTTSAWTIAAGKRFGPIIDLKLIGAAPTVSGGSAASTLTSTDPNANYTN